VSSGQSKLDFVSIYVSPHWLGPTRLRKGDPNIWRAIRQDLSYEVRDAWFGLNSLTPIGKFGLQNP